MKLRISNNDIKTKRGLSWQEAQDYTGLGRTACRKFCDEIGATRKIGKRVLFDKNVIDEHFNSEA